MKPALDGGVDGGAELLSAEERELIEALEFFENFDSAQHLEILQDLADD